MDPGARIEIPTPFEVGPVNCYVLDERGLTLVDPGPATDGAYQALTDGLDRLGYAVADVDRILITHPHMDHFGLANRVATEATAEVWAHAFATARLEDPLAHFDREQAFFTPFLRSMGVPDDIVDTVVGLPEPYMDFQEPVHVDRELTDGDGLDAGHDLRVVYTPGHDPGSACFVSDGGDFALTGDHVLADVSPNPLLTLDPESPDERTRSLPQYIASLDRIRSRGVTTGYAGHHGTIEDLPARVEEIKQHHEDRKERIAGMIDEAGGITAYEIMQELFPNLPATETFPGMSEVIGHLDLLEDDDWVEITVSDGVTRYSIR